MAVLRAGALWPAPFPCRQQVAELLPGADAVVFVAHVQGSDEDEDVDTIKTRTRTRGRTRTRTGPGPEPE